MTVKRRARQRRREDDGPRASAGETASADHEQRAPSPELLRLQALGGNAAVQRLVTDATQLHRQELEGEEAPAATQTGAGAVLASMWSGGVLGPLGRALELIEVGDGLSLHSAYRELHQALGFIQTSATPIASSFPDAEIACHDVQESIQVVILALEPHLGTDGRSLEEIGGKLTTVTARAAEFSAVFEG